MISLEPSIASVRTWVEDAKHIVVLTGAGISAESGIPDFRGPQGVWTKDPQAEKLSNIHYYIADPEIRKKSWQARLAHPAWTARPNAGHAAIVELERRGKLHALITQNIDGLHQKAGNSSERVIEVHGTVHDVVCLSCGWKGPMQATLDRVRSGESDPPCAAEADLFISVGTSLQVYPIAGAVPAAKNAGARVVILNAEATPFDGIAHAVFRGAIGEVLPRIVGMAAVVST